MTEQKITITHNSLEIDHIKDLADMAEKGAKILVYSSGKGESYSALDDFRRATYKNYFFCRTENRTIHFKGAGLIEFDYGYVPKTSDFDAVFIRNADLCDPRGAFRVWQGANQGSQNIFMTTSSRGGNPDWVDKAEVRHG